jgi:hypothetical protein
MWPLAARGTHARHHHAAPAGAQSRRRACHRRRARGHDADAPEVALTLIEESSGAFGGQPLRDDLLEVFAQFDHLGVAQAGPEVPFDQRLEPTNIGRATRQ